IDVEARDVLSGEAKAWLVAEYVVAQPLRGFDQCGIGRQQQRITRLGGRRGARRGFVGGYEDRVNTHAITVSAVDQLRGIDAVTCPCTADDDVASVDRATRRSTALTLPGSHIWSRLRRWLRSTAQRLTPMLCAPNTRGNGSGGCAPTGYRSTFRSPAHS